MSVASNKEEFASRMSEALVEEVSQSPTADQIRRYFRTLSGNSQDAIDAYIGYASLFFVHVGQSRTPGADVVYPGGSGRDVCDGFSEVLARREERGRHVIDCRGFSVMGVELLREAGFGSVQYMIAVPPSATGDSWQGHVFVRMVGPDGRRIFLGNNHIYDSPSGAVEGLAGWSPEASLNVHYGVGDTYQEALENATDFVRERDEEPLSDDSVVAPFSARRSATPTLREE
jgi:hypothetical protein